MFSALKFFNNQIKENGWGFYMIEDCFEIIEYCRLLHKLVYTKRSPTDWFIDQKKIMNEWVNVEQLFVCGLFEMVVKVFFVCRSGVGVQRKPVDWISSGCQSMFTLLFQNIHYPQGRYKVLPKEMTKPIHYPVSLIPGQFQNYFKR